MNRIIPLTSALLIAAFGATSAFAGPASDAWVAQTKAALQAKVEAAGLADDGKTVKLRVRLGAAGPNSVQVGQSSGSVDFDNAVKSAAKDTDVSRPPSELVGRTVVFTLGQP